MSSMQALMASSFGSMPTQGSGGSGGRSGGYSSQEDSYYNALLKANLENQEHDNLLSRMTHEATLKRNAVEEEWQRNQWQAKTLAEITNRMMNGDGTNPGMMDNPYVDPQDKLSLNMVNQLASAGLPVGLPAVLKMLEQQQGSFARSGEMTDDMKEYGLMQTDPNFSQYMQQRNQGNVPAAIQQFEYMNQLSPEDQQKFLLAQGRVKDVENVGQASKAEAEGKSGIAERGKALDEEFQAVRGKAQAIGNIYNDMSRIDALLDDNYTGALGDKVQSLQGIAHAMGLNVSDEALASKEAASALANALALKFRDPNGGMGMPGSLSDSDREFLRSMTPSVLMSKDGRKKVLDLYRKQYDDAQDLAAEAEAYASENNGMLNGGWYKKRRELEKKQRERVVVQSQPQAPAASQSGIAEGTVQVNRRTGQRRVYTNGQWVIQ